MSMAINKLTISIILVLLYGFVIPIQAIEQSQSEEFDTYKKFIRMKKEAGIDVDSVRKRKAEKIAKKKEDLKEFYVKRSKYRYFEDITVGIDFNSFGIITSSKSVTDTNSSYVSSTVNSKPGISLFSEIPIVQYKGYSFITELIYGSFSGSFYNTYGNTLFKGNSRIGSNFKLGYKFDKNHFCSALIKINNFNFD